MSLIETLSCLEKSHYPFKRYPHTRHATLLFPGCAFPSQFPRTMDSLAWLCKEQGVGVAYDCCGNPLKGYGRQESAARVMQGIRRRLDERGCECVVAVCPNCLDHLRNGLDIPVVSLYEWFDRIGMDAHATFEEGLLFVPCPDRQRHEIEHQLRSRYDMMAVSTMKQVGCCGLRPDIAAKGIEGSQKHANRIVAAAADRLVYSYCASCLGWFSHAGLGRCRHVASVIVGVDETPDARHALMNRAKRKFGDGFENL